MCKITIYRQFSTKLAGICILDANISSYSSQLCCCGNSLCYLAAHQIIIFKRTLKVRKCQLCSTLASYWLKYTRRTFSSSLKKYGREKIEIFNVSSGQLVMSDEKLLDSK